jgi:energy-converting hydrogenase Eha subunit E
MAVVLTYSPGAELPILIAVGLPLALAGLAYTYVDALMSDPARLATFSGYPIHFQSLWLPGLLAACVLLTHVFSPRWSVLTVISLLSPALTLVVLRRRHGGRRALAEVRRHVNLRLPEMSGELLLFLAAGVLAVGLSSVFAGFNDRLPFAAFTGTTASLTLVVMVALAAIGIHPIISVTAMATWLAPIDPDPTLLAMVFLMTWGIGVASSPLSATHLTIQGRYGIESWRFFRWNLSYCLFMLALSAVLLHLYTWW